MKSPQKPSKQAELQRLKKIWYAKLAKSGFVDIEHTEFRLVTSANNALTQAFKRGKSSSDFVSLGENKAEYFRLAGHMLYDYEFKTLVDKMIWKLHSEGLGYNKIISELKKHNIIRSRWDVRVLIEKLREEMLKLYRSGVDND